MQNSTTSQTVAFFDVIFSFPFSLADVLPHPSGNALKDSEAKASVKLRRRKNLCCVYLLGRNKSEAFTLNDASSYDSFQNICRAEWSFLFLVKKMQLFET